MPKKLIKMICLCLTLALFAAAFAGCGKTEENKGSSVTSLTFCESWDLGGLMYTALTPEVRSNYGIIYYAANFYETLVNYENGNITPGLATKWEMSEDGKVYTFILREGVKFSDGTDMNAEAVKRSLEVVPQNLGQYNGSYGLLSSLFDKIEAVDEKTVAIHLKQPYYGTLKDLTMLNPMGIVSPTAIGEDGKPLDVLNSATFGTGPFMYAGEHDATSYTFVRNPYYYGETPQLEKFVVKIIQDNDAKLLALKNGEVDAIVGKEKLTYDGFGEMENQNGFAAATSDMAANTRILAFNAGSEQFKDKNVRLAISYAINKQALCDSLFAGLETPADSYFDKSLPYCDVDVQSRAFDKQKAVSMLEEAGWKDSDGDGIRDKGGIKLSGEMIYIAGNAMLDDLALAIAAQLKEIGVEAKPSALEMMAYYQATLEGKFGLALTQTYGLNYDPMTTVSNMNPSMHIDPVSEQALAGLPDAAGLINTLNSTADEQVVKDTYKTILTEINDSATVIPISYIKQLAVYNKGKIDSFAFNGQPDNIDLLKIKVK